MTRLAVLLVFITLLFKAPLLPSAPDTQEASWLLYRSPEFGFSIQHPPDLGPWDLVRAQGVDITTVPADIWFNSNIHVAVIVPALPQEVVSRWWPLSNPLNPARAAREIQLTPSILGLARQSIIDLPVAGSADEKNTLASIEYLIHGEGADYIVGYRYAGKAGAYEKRLRQTFERMAATFQLFPKKYSPPLGFSDRVLPAAAFDFPVDPPSGGEPPPWFAGFNQRNQFLVNSSACYGKPYSQLQHTAEDWFRPAGTRVFAAANGLVVYAEEASYPGAVVVIEHALPEEWQITSGVKVVYSMYGHLDVNGLVSAWSTVKRGQYIGRLLDQGQNTHLHMEIRSAGDMTGILICPSSGQTSLAGPGYTDSGIHPGNYGYVSPTQWIETHRGAALSNSFLAPTAPRAD